VRASGGADRAAAADFASLGEAAAKELILRLAPGAAVRGKGAAAGEPVEIQSDDGFFGGRATAADDGTFAFESLLPGRYHVARRFEKRSVDLGAGETADMTFGDMPVVRGRVTRGGEPVAAPVVLFFLREDGRETGGSAAAFADEDGRFAAALRPGRYLVTAQAQEGPAPGLTGTLEVEGPSADEVATVVLGTARATCRVAATLGAEFVHLRWTTHEGRAIAGERRVLGLRADGAPFVADGLAPGGYEHVDVSAVAIYRRPFEVPPEPGATVAVALGEADR